MSSLAFVSLLSAALTPAPDCGALASLKLPDVRIVDDTIIQPTAPQRAAGRSAVCRVRGVIGKEIKFTLLLPDNWNQRFMMGGQGGFAGSVTNMAGASVNSGYATSGTDTGHEGDDAKWALNNPERVENYAHLAVHRVAQVSKDIIKAYYGTAPVKSYFYGCSNGGREALMEAERHPEDFDGIVAIAPVLDFGGSAVTFVRNTQAAFPTGFAKPVLSPDVLRLVEAKVFDACDARDGVRDQVLDDPRQCDFKVASLPACPNDVAGEQCVTRQQRAALQTIYSPLTVNGRVLFPGQALGNEGEGDAWPAWITGTPGSPANQPPTAQAMFGTEFFRYLVYGDSTWDYTKADVATLATDVKRVATLLSPNDPDLSAFVKRGGKLIMAHGWSDPALMAMSSINYFDALHVRDKNADSYIRLFMMPGVLHCSGGTGCDAADWYSAIANWVEKGVAPERIVAKKMAPAQGGAPAQVVRTRPLCAYPKHAVYAGTGSTDDEASFVCK
ncbi:MAG TPA: tannase/feruloyl esterase family alpha/beta hydrolase [Gemmatimonadaceae bacterium]|nr:tannase/feruloyl esterase family alpha/beta hydrolase [Gemmatimonadaceae bacterium]